MTTCRSLLSLFIFILFFGSLVGCTRVKIIDKLSIVHIYGFDLNDDGQLVGSALFPDFTKSKSGDEIQFLKVSAPKSSLFTQKMDKFTSTPIQLSKVRVLVFGKDYAKTGVKNMVGRFISTPQLGTNIHIAVSEQSAAETLKVLKKRKSLTLADRLEQNMQRHELPMVNLHIFLNHFYGEGMDPYLPMVGINKEKEIIEVKGIGIFQNDKLMLQLDGQDTFLFSVLKDTRTEGTYKIAVKENDRDDMYIVRGFRSNKKWELSNHHGQQELNLSLDLDWTISQYPEWLDPSKPGDVKQMKEVISEKLKEDINELLTTLKEHEVDPIGIGNIVRVRDRDWDESTFYQTYPELPINIDIQFEVIHSGLEN